MLGCRRLRRGLLTPRCSIIASDAGDSSLLGARTLPTMSGLLGARTSPATPGTPRSSVLGHRQQCRGLLAPRCSIIASDVEDSSMLPWWSDIATSCRCAIKLLHAVWIKVLILGSTSRVLIRACRMMSAKLSDFFFSLTLLQDSFFIFQQARGLSGHTSPHERHQLRRGLLGARTSLPTPGTPRSSVLEHRQRRWGLLAPWCSVIASDAEDSSLLNARSLPPTPGTPRSSILGHR